MNELFQDFFNFLQDINNMLLNIEQFFLRLINIFLDDETNKKYQQVMGRYKYIYLSFINIYKYYQSSKK